MKFQMNIPVHFSDSDASGKMSAKSIMRAMLESSMTQSNAIEKEMESKDFWVLFRWQVEFFHSPRPGDVLRATTYTIGFHKFYAFREFQLHLGEQLVARAKTTWLLLNEKTGRPMRVSDELANRYGVTPSEFEIPELEEVSDEECEYTTILPARTYDIDGNGHVNNLVYVDWALEAIPYAYRETRTLRKLMLTYRKQVLYPELMIARATIQEDQAWVTLREKDANEMRAWAATVWE